MTKLYSLFGGTTTDTEVKAVEVNQVIQMEGYSYDRYVVYKITHKERYGYQYHLINLRTFNTQRSQIIKPLSQKFGIGMYYDENNIEFKSNEEVAELLVKAENKKQAEKEEEERKKAEREAIEAIGREWLNNNLPKDAKSMIVAYKEGCDHDPYADYQRYYPTNYQILGFSRQVKNSVPELRKYAALFEGTMYLQNENDNDVHNRDKYDYYIGYCNDWMIKKIVIQDRANFIEKWAYTTANPDNIHINNLDTESSHVPTQEKIAMDNLHFEIVDYSEKAIALFGDTKPIKDQLGDRNGLNGKFNARLTHKGEKTAGWIFSKSKEKELKKLLGVE